MFNTFYNCLASILVVLLTPFLFLRAKSRGGLSQKLGIIPDGFTVAQPNIWFHAVSVGEFSAINPLLNAFHEHHPEYNVVVSTTTATGQKLAQDKVGSWAKVIYMPLDAPWAVKSWLDKINPETLVIAETEIWPGLTSACVSRGIPMLVVNGRISPRSFKTYYRMRAIFGSVLTKFHALGVQSKTEAERYSALTGSKDRIEILGNLKFDGLKAKSPADIEALKQQLALAPETPVLIAGSTHEGEESALIECYQKLKLKYSGLKLIIAPRHPERFSKVADYVEKCDLKLARFSRAEKLGENGNDIYLLDAIGHLLDFYALATVSFVGGTIAPIGGHNLLEPYLYNVPVVCGKNIQKTRDVAYSLLDRDALYVVPDQKQLEEKIDLLLGDAKLRKQIGEQGHALILESRGATQRALDLIDATLSMNATTTTKNAKSIERQAQLQSSEPK